jgi:IS5 family transposase
MIGTRHELALLADTINRQYFEEEYSSLFSQKDVLGIPIRLITGCLLVKHLKNPGDDSLPKVWIEKPYMQYLCGMYCSEHRFPFAPGYFCHFGKRIGEAGFEKFFACNMQLHGKEVAKTSRLVLSKSTVQENAITFPAGTKLCRRVIDTGQVFKRLKTLSGHQVRELERNLSGEERECYVSELDEYKCVIHQWLPDRDKVYSIHKPFTRCIARGKAHKPYKFGNRAGLMTSGSAGKKNITAVQAFPGNPYGGDTIVPLPVQMASDGIKLPRKLVYHRGGRGKNEIQGVRIVIPGKFPKKSTAYRRSQKRKKCRARAAIESIIVHLKTDFRMTKNCLQGGEGIQINALMAARVWNLKKMMKKLTENLFWTYCFSILYYQKTSA